MNLYFDIETVPTQRDDLKQLIAETIKHPAKMTVPATIATWERDKKQQAIQDTISKTSLDGGFGEIISIAWAFDDGDVQGAIRTLEDSEKDFIGYFLSDIEKQKVINIRWIGHNIINFDLRFLFQRCLVNGINVPIDLLTAINARPNEYEKVFDTMTYWGGAYNKNSYISLEKLCAIFNIQTPKNDLDGSKVWEYVQAGRYDEVLEYNKNDVDITRQVAKRMYPEL